MDLLFLFFLYLKVVSSLRSSRPFSDRQKKVGCFGDHAGPGVLFRPFTGYVYGRILSGSCDSSAEISYLREWDKEHFSPCASMDSPLRWPIDVAPTSHRWRGSRVSQTRYHFL